MAAAVFDKDYWNKLNEDELFDLLQEECAEVIQAVSKRRRFGMDYFSKSRQMYTRNHLQEEIEHVQWVLKKLGYSNEVTPL